MRAAMMMVVVAVVTMGCPGPAPSGTGGGSATGGGGTFPFGGGSATGGGGTFPFGGGTAATGGSGGTGGGTTQTGGGSATGGGGGGTTSTGGTAIFANPGFYDQMLAVGADGTVHLAHTTGAAQNVRYGSCRANCGTVEAWNEVDLTTAGALGATTVGVEGLQIDATGRLHLLMSGVVVSGHANEIVYASCAANCGSPASWTFTDLGSLAPGASAIGTYGTLMVDGAGGVSFLSFGTFNSLTSRFYSCASNCTQSSSWSQGPALNGNPLKAQRDASGVVHVMMRGGATANNDSLLNYARCASNCTAPGSWRISTLGFLTNGKDYVFGFGVSPTGRVSMAYNQGVTTDSATDSKKLFVASCTPPADCLNLDQWTSFSIGVSEEGSDGATLTASGEGLLLATTDGFQTKLYGCDASCGTGGSWTGPTVIDDTQLINQALPPWTGLCSAGSGSWWPQKPAVAVTASGVAVVYNPYGVITCPGAPSIGRAPPVGRLITSF